MLTHLEKLNEKQRTFVMHVYKCLKTEKNVPFQLYLAGSAGVGKSTVISALYQLITHHFDHVAGNNPNSLKVLITAFAGKAAFLVHGTTLHSAFALPVKKRNRSKPLVDLSSDFANTIRTELNDLKLIIIDEISMVDNIILNEINARLIQVTGCSLPFGGISIIVVGDLKQLPPVSGQPVFMAPDQSDTAIFSNLWGFFKYFELTEIMRQKDETQFITFLNNLADGAMEQQDIQLFENRVVQSDTSVPAEAIRLYHTNKDVDAYNSKRISEFPGAECVVTAKDSVGKNVPKRISDRALKSLLKSNIHDQGNLPTELRLKIGIKYMLSVNMDITDGLVNGACGTLKYIKFKTDDSPEILFFEYPSNIGTKAKSEINHTMKGEKEFCNDWVPIKKTTIECYSGDENVRVFREQFPLVPAEAMTIHKSQGQTYESVCVSLSSGRATRQLWYVALSRVTKLENLYIIGKFKQPNPPKDTDPVRIELKELKENKQLNLCFNTLQKPTGKIIGYHNVRSFLKYEKHIQNDSWYSKCDILIFAETQTISTDRPALHEFKLIDRFDEFRKRGPRGILVFAKNDMRFKIMKTSIEKSTSYHSTVFLIDFMDFYVVSGYKSPLTPGVEFCVF